MRSDESWSDLKWAVVDGILNTMVSGLESIKDQYPKAVSIELKIFRYLLSGLIPEGGVSYVDNEPSVVCT